MGGIHLGSMPYVSDVYPAISTDALDGTLKDKVVVIVGAGRGIGKSIALSVAAAGASVALAARNEAELSQVAEEIKTTYGTKVLTCKTDATSYADLKNLVAQTESALGPIDVAIANSAMSYLYAVWEKDFDAERWWQSQEVNVKGPLMLFQLVIPSMIARKTGILICTSSTGSTTKAFAGMSSYGCSKCAVNRLMETLDTELASHGIQSYAVQPCSTLTTLGDGRTHPIPDGLPNLQVFKSKREHILTDKPELAGQTFAYLSSGKAKVLSGHFVNSNQNVVEVVEKMEALSPEERDKWYTHVLKTYTYASYSDNMT